MRLGLIIVIAAHSVLAACAPGIDRARDNASLALPDQAHTDKNVEDTRAAELTPILNCQESNGHHLYEKEYVCPIGGEKFKSLTLGTHSTYGRYLDWEPLSYMEFPAPVPVCPSNGFVIYKNEFSDDELNRLEAAINLPEYKRDFQSRNASYFLFGRLMELTEVPDGYSLWWIFLNSTWEAQQCGSAKYSDYASKTIGAAREALKTFEQSDYEYWMLNIIIPNLYRRSGKLQLAKAWLDDLGDHRPGDDIENRDYFNLAFSLLESAVEAGDVTQIPIEPEEDSEPNGN